MGRIVSVNVGLPRDVAWRVETVHTGIWKQAVQGKRMDRKLNVVGDAHGVASSFLHKTRFGVTRLRGDIYE